MKGSKSTVAGPDRLTITLGAGQRRKLAAIAKRRRTSQATVVRWALDEYIVKNSVARRTQKPR